MGAAFSGSSLYRLVGGVEIVTSSVIIGFGVQTLVQFYGMEDDFQDKFERIQYSAITAVAQGALTIIAAIILLVGSREAPIQYQGTSSISINKEKEATAEEQSDSIAPSELGPSKAETKRIAQTLKFWLIFSVLSILTLLTVFFLSFKYCIRTKEDATNENAIISGTNTLNLNDDVEDSSPNFISNNPIIYGWNQVKSGGGKKQDNSPCYTASSEVVTLRSAIGALFTYCLVNVFALTAFLFLMYSQLQRVLRRGRRQARSSKGDREVCIPPEQETNGKEG